MHSRRVALLAALWLVAGTAGAQRQETPPLTAGADAEPLIEVTPPRIALSGVPTEISVRVTGPLPEVGARLVIMNAEERVLGEATARGGETSTIEIVAERGPLSARLTAWPDSATRFTLRAVPGWLALVPPCLAILLALALRQVVPALLAGVWAGASVVHAGPLVGLARTIDHYVVGSLTDPDRAAIVVFTLLLGGMVGILSRSGGMLGLVEALRPWATSSRRGQLVTWLMGLVVFFDDYANTLLVGNTMRPVSDRLRISREKLAYIVDSTAAPVASVALVSTWIGYEVSLIGEALRDVGSTREAYVVFLESLPYNFYPFLTLCFGLLVASSTRDFGPMLAAERRAATGRVLREGAVPLADFDERALAPPEGKPRSWVNAVLPILLVLSITFAGLWVTGRGALAADGTALAEGGFRRLGQLFGAGDSYKALSWGSFAGCLSALLLAVGRGVLRFAEAIEAWIAGMKSMIVAMVILILAWSIGSICSDLDTAGYLVNALSDTLDPRLLPAIVFLLAAATAFSTGTSWATMAILIPLALPTAIGVAGAAGLDAAASHAVLLGALSAVLAGAIFGDHCSPISDTTVMSSMASGCDHIDHVRTQLPYALLVGVVAVLCGYLPVGYGLSPWIGMLLGAVVLAGVLFRLGRTSD